MHEAEMKLLKSTQPLPKQTACQAGQPSSCPQHLALHKRGAGGGGAEGPPLPAASSTGPGEEGSGPLACFSSSSAHTAVGGGESGGHPQVIESTRSQ